MTKGSPRPGAGAMPLGGRPHPRVQVALDVTSGEVATTLAAAALEAGADQLEIGKPLVEFLGLRGVAPIIARFPGIRFELDIMIMAGSARYVGAAADIGAQGVTVSALAPLATVEDAIACGDDLGVRVCVDLFNVVDPVVMARTVDDMGAGAIMVHVGVDQRRHDPGFSQLDELRQIASSVSAPVAYATYDIDDARAAVAAGASEIVQGAPLIGADDPGAALTEFIDEIRGLDGGRTT